MESKEGIVNAWVVMTSECSNEIPNSTSAVKLSQNPQR